MLLSVIAGADCKFLMTFHSFVVSVAKINFGTSKRVEQYFGVVKLDQYNFKRLTRFENILEKLMSIVSGV